MIQSASIADGGNRSEDEHFQDNFMMCLPSLQIQDKEEYTLMFSIIACFI